MKNRKVVVMWLAVMLLGGGAIAGTVAYGNSSNDNEPVVTREQVLEVSDRSSIAASRLSLGFSGSQQVVNELLNNERARNFFVKTGLLLDIDEKAIFDARMALADSVRSALVEARHSSAFAGARLEHTGEGIYHFYVTSDDVGYALSKAILQKVPRGAAVRIHQVEYSHEYLVNKMREAWLYVSDNEKGRNGLHTVMVDTIGNGLIIEIDEGVQYSNPQLANKIVAGLGSVPIQVYYNQFPGNFGCTIQDCVDPMAGGIRITRGSPSEYRCTLGFIVKQYLNTLAVTAGHCGHVGSNDWYHDGYGSDSFGSEVASWTYGSGDLDAMVIDIPDDQGSNHVASCPFNAVHLCQDITGYLNSNELEVGMSLTRVGATSGITSGQITNLAAEWADDICQCTLQGIATSIFGADGGDSGGPMWRTNTNDAVALMAFGNETRVMGPRIEDVLLAYRLSLQTTWGQ